MIQNKHDLFFLLLVIFTGLSFSVSVAADEKIDKWLKNNPAKKAAINNFSPAMPLEDRVVPTPGFVLDLFRRLDVTGENKNNPFMAYTLTAGELEEVKVVIRKLPRVIKEKVSPYLLGVCFVENFDRSGFTLPIPTDGENYYLIILNSKILKTGASEWKTKMERSFFTPEPGYEMKVDIGGGLSGFYYLFNHEIAHVFDYVAKITPGLRTPENKDEFEKYPFISGAWVLDASDKPKRGYTFNGYPKANFWGVVPETTISDAPHFYDELRRSPYISLYGSVGWLEDFAEYAAAWMNDRTYHRPWTLTISKNGKVIYEMKDILERKNIKKRVELIEKLLSEQGLKDNTKQE